MLKGEADKSVCETEVAFVVVREFADKLLRQCDSDRVVPAAGAP
jgi:hypothetical protein